MSEEILKPSTAANVEIPSAKDLLKAGVQFGHESKRWNPKMRKYIFGEKNSIHIIDIAKTEDGLKNAANFLAQAAANGKVLFVGTKRQASEIVRDEAVRAGAYFVNVRWAGGVLTNFKVVKKSLDKLNSLEKQLEEGVHDRTKYEVSRMKKEWQRLDRLYSGIKALNEKPTAVVLVDSNFEKAAIKECRKIKIPLVSIVDTNSDPDVIDYPIPANDDAIGSLKLIVNTLANSVLAGNKGNGVRHHLKDYSKVEVKITRSNEEKVENKENVTVELEGTEPKTQEPSREERPTRSRTKVKGILEKVKEEAETKKKTVSKSKKAK